MFAALKGSQFYFYLLLLQLVLCRMAAVKRLHVRGASKKFVDFVNKIKSTDAIYLKLSYVCSQLNMNQRGKFQKNHLINIVVMTICSMGVSATRSTPRR